MFVDRDQGQELRAWLQAARDTGGFLVLVGDSSVGKTRLLYETAREILADFVVLAPDLGDGELVNQLAAASFPLPRLLVWLDELQRFLDGPYLTRGSTPISAATVRRLLDAPTPVVLVGTLWPEYANELRASDPDPTTRRPQSRHPNAVDVLDDRRVQEVVLRTFSENERRAAARLAATDPRLATALADRDYNVTEVLAGARELVRRYERATHEQQAVVHAAVDARRLGIQAPLSEQLLCAAARGYLSGAYPDDAWFGPVLAELTSAGRPQDRATAPLLPIPNPDRSRVLGYTVADYLLQRLARQRRAMRVAAATWQALIDHTSDRDDLWRLANSADNRLLYRYAITLYRRLADAGNWSAVWRLPELLAGQGRIDEAIELLQVLNDVGDLPTTFHQVLLLAKHGRIDELCARADAGDQNAAEQLAKLLAEQGRVDEAIKLFQVLADAGDQYAALRLAKLLADQGRVDEAIKLFQVLADAGWSDAAWRLAELLAEQGRIDELRARADAGDRPAASKLGFRALMQGRVEEAFKLLRTAQTDADDELAAEQLTGLDIEQRRIEKLRARADAGDRPAAWELAKLLAAHGRVDELRARADAGDQNAAAGLAELLANQGRVDELLARAEAGSEPAAWGLAKLLAKQDRIDELRAWADAGGQPAAAQLAELLAKQGRVDELRAEVDAGTPTAGNQLVDLLVKQGKTEVAEQLRRWGLNPDGSIAGEGGAAEG